MAQMHFCDQDRLEEDSPEQLCHQSIICRQREVYQRESSFHCSWHHPISLSTMNHNHLSKHHISAHSTSTNRSAGVCVYVCVCLIMKVGWGWGIADTFSMMTSFSGINGVAQQLCVEPLIQLAATLISLAFPQLKYGGSVSYHPIPCIPLNPPSL